MKGTWLFPGEKIIRKKSIKIFYSVAPEYFTLLKKKLCDRVDLIYIDRIDYFSHTFNIIQLDHGKGKK